IPLGAAEAERSLGARTGARRAGTRKCCASSESRVTSHESRSMTPPAVDLRLLVPELVVTATAVAVMLAGLFLPAGRPHLLRWPRGAASLAASATTLTGGAHPTPAL